MAPFINTDNVPYYKTPAKKKILKTSVKFLAHCKNSHTRCKVLRSAKDNVHKAICNAAYNLQSGPLSLTASQKSALAKYRKQISFLSDKNKKFQQKRKVLNQTGGSALIPIILSTILTAIGRRLFQ